MDKINKIIEREAENGEIIKWSEVLSKRLTEQMAKSLSEYVRAKGYTEDNADVDSLFATVPNIVSIAIIKAVHDFSKPSEGLGQQLLVCILHSMKEMAEMNLLKYPEIVEKLNIGDRATYLTSKSGTSRVYEGE